MPSVNEFLSNINTLSEAIRQRLDSSNKQNDALSKNTGQQDVVEGITRAVTNVMSSILSRQFPSSSPSAPAAQTVMSVTSSEEKPSVTSFGNFVAGKVALRGSTQAISAGYSAAGGAGAASAAGAAGASGVASSGGGLLASAGGAIAASGPVGWTIAGVVAAAAATIGSTAIMAKLFVSAKNYVADWSRELQQANDQYSANSGGMAAAMSSREVQEMLRSQRMGDELASSAGLLTGAEQRRKNQEEKLFTSLSKLENSVVAVLEESFAQMLEVLKPITETIADIADMLSKYLGSEQTNSDSWAVGDTLRRFSEEQEREAKKTQDTWNRMDRWMNGSL